VAIVSRIMNRISSTGLAVACVCGLLACATGPRKTDAEKQADDATVQRVQQALDGDRILYDRHILIHADSGVVRLSGFVWTQEDLLEAERVAGSIQGVSRVVNELELQRNGIDNSNVAR
jgi:osmotically-inducible protein OsmY